MNLKERAQATLEMEFTSASIAEGLVEANARLDRDVREWQDLRDQLKEVQRSFYEAEMRIKDTERAVNLFTNALNEEDK